MSRPIAYIRQAVTQRVVGMYLYAISESRAGPCKIGYAADPAKRLCELQIGNPRPLALVHACMSEHYRRAERIAHRRAGLTHHLRGEWFAVDIATAKEAVIFGCDEASRIEARRSPYRAGYVPSVPKELRPMLAAAYELTKPRS